MSWSYLRARRFMRNLTHRLSNFDQPSCDSEGRGALHLNALLNNKEGVLTLMNQGICDHADSYGMRACDILRYLEKEPPLQAPLIPLFIPQLSRERQAITPRKWSQKFDFSYQSSLRFDNGYTLNRLIDKAARKLNKRHLKSENEWAKALFLHPFLDKRVPPIEIRYIDAIIGYGIFATEDISELTFIGEYTGHVRKRDAKKDRPNPYIFSYSVTSSETSYVIDAKKEGNFVRFINHSGYPNCTSRWMIAGGLCHIIIFANQLIRKGTQLTYDYGESYWKHRINPIDF